MSIDYLYLYDDPDAAGLDVDYLAHWVAALFPEAQVAVRTDFLTFHLARFSEAERDQLVTALCEQLERVEVDNLVRPQDRDRLPALPPAERGLDVVYEDVGLQAVLRLLIPEEETRLSHLHLVFTANFLGDWREDESYLRVRAAVLGLPNIISASGLVEALRLPKQYHFLRQQLAVLGIEEDVEETFADQTIGYGDPRLNEICKGYVMQAIMYRLSGETGCDDPACRLHLHGTHAGALRAQAVEKAGLCERHQEVVAEHGGQPE